MALSTQARSLLITPTIGAATYDDGDLIWQPESMGAESVFQKGRIAQLQSVGGVLGDNITPALELWFFNDAVDLGTVGSAIDVTAAVLSPAFLGVQPIVSGDWKQAKPSTNKLLDVASVRALMLEAVEASRVLYVAGVARASAALTANSLTLRLGVKWW
jgi:hypothetical protein